MGLIHIVDYYDTYHVVENRYDKVAICGESLDEYDMERVTRGIEDERSTLWERAKVEDEEYQATVCKGCLHHAEEICSWKNM